MSDQVGGLFDFGPLVAGNSNQPVPAVASGQQSAIEVAPAATEPRRLDDVEVGHGRRSQRG